ncbi:MAG: hypothetical protein KIS61_36275, partial [Candidatus Eremiobacteraeota bacterium]|nr:hypothetical protein [Candidatus Eremiobacteraeota bacterium]
LICEVGEAQINELWDDITEEAWEELEPRWLHSLEELIREMAGEGVPRGALRTYLVKHLSHARRPQDSYFAKTMLFQDWHGRFYSLFQLLSLGPGQSLCLVTEEQAPLEDFMPVGVFIRAGHWETRLFKSISSLKLLELDYLLRDLNLSRRPSFLERRNLSPTFGQARVTFCVRGVELETVKVDSILGFEAWVRNDELTFQIRLENERLGASRFRLAMNAKAKRFLDQLVAEARELSPPLPLQAEWLAWAREATLRQVAAPELACWPTLWNGMVSLQDLRRAERVNWTSGPGSAQFPRELLLINLSDGQRAYLQQQCQNEWVGQDLWFAEQERLRLFLEKPMWSPNFQALGTYPGVWLVADKDPGKVIHLLRGRWLREEEGLIPPGLRATVECAGFEDAPDLSELLERIRRHLADWLAVARPRNRGMLYHWREWAPLSQEINDCLRRQPWFQTNQGLLSWEDILQKGEIYRVVAIYPDLPRDRLFLAESGTPPGLLDSLLAQHGKGHSVPQTARLLQEEKRLAERRQRLADQLRRLNHLKFKIKVEWGDVGLSGKSTKDCWLLLPERAVLLHNVPSGLVGALECDQEYRLRRIGSQEYAELNQGVRRRFYQALQPLLLQRIQAGRLNAAELATFCEVLMLGMEDMAQVRWIPCADGSLTSLAQLKLDSEERDELGYWPKTYAFSSGGARITPILSSPLMLEVVGRYCGRRPQPLPKPLLHQDVKLKMPSFRGFGQVLRSLGHAADRLREQVVNVETRRATLFETLFKETPPGDGKALLTALRRQAAQLTQGAARRELLKVLDKARIGDCRDLWDFTPELVLSSSWLRAHLGSQEPPVEVTLSLLLCLVSAINARSQPFTDKMEEKFLGSLTEELVGSWATSGNAGSSEVTRP